MRTRVAPWGRRSAALWSAAGAVSFFAGVAGADSGIANVYFTWTDRLGNAHPVGYAWTDGFYNTLLSSNNSGGPAGFMSSTGVSVYTGSALVGNLDFFGTIYSSYGVGGVEWFRIRDAGGTTYSQRWPTTGFYTTTGPGGDNFSFHVDNNTYQNASYGIGQALMFADLYAGNRLGASAPFFTVGYDPTLTGSFYNKNGPAAGNSYLQIDRHDWASWDVIMHEFGHHVAVWNNIDTSPGGSHAFGVDSIRGNGTPDYPALGSDAGTRLAWSEAYATYFGLSAVRSGNLAAAIPGLPHDEYDDWYDDYDAPGTRAQNYQHLNFGVNAERPRLLLGGAGGGSNAGDFMDGVRRGEGDEYSVLLAMWDYYDATNEAHNGSDVYHERTRRWCADRVNYGDVDAWNRVITANGGAKTFRDYWTNITADVGTAAGRAKISGLATVQKDEAVAALGESLEAAGIANVPVSPDGDTAPLNTRRPTFTFQEQNNSNSDFFRVLVFSLDWTTLVYGSPVINDEDFGLSLIDHTPTVDLPLGTFWWVALNSPAMATLAQIDQNNERYAMYWSGARRFTLIPAPGSLALLAFGVVLAARRRR